MVTTDIVKFTLQLIIVGMTIRVIEMKLLDRNPNDPMGKALAFIY
jgi:hypothetical protein